MEYKRKWRGFNFANKNMSITDKVLALRGIKDKNYFLNGTISDLYDISLLNDGIKADKIIEEAIKNKGKIVIYSDYDTDGASGAAVSYMMLKELGADVYYYTNNRFAQGYGMCISGIDEIIRICPDTKLIITVDNGIVASEAAKYVKKLGIKLIITDHHEQGDELPIADAVVDPKRIDSTYPFDGICGAVVVWKVLRELYKDKKEANKYLDILAIATAGDVVPLVDENRIIVKEGLKLLNNESRKSLKILKNMTNTTEINSHFTLGFIYSPIFNAVSRLNGSINDVIQMLISNDEEFIKGKIQKLIRINEGRKELTNRQVEEAEKMLDTKGIKEVILLYNENFHEGIVGLIAGRLKEKYNRPTFILTQSKDGNIKGSARSIENFNVKKNLDKCKDLLLGYGGHAMAGGLSLKPKNLELLEEKLIELAKEELTEDDFIKKFYYVGTLEEKEVNINLIKELEKMEPYGPGFEKPLIKLKNFNVRRVFEMGSEKEHLKLTGDRINLLLWRQAKTFKERGNPLNITALGYPELNVYNKNVSLQFIVNEDNFY